jgi:hypothetical protein
LDGTINLSEATAASVRLSGSHLGGLLARQLTTRGDLRLDDGFTVASGSVDLAGAQIGGDLRCTGGQFSNPGGDAIDAEKLSVVGQMSCEAPFSAAGQVILLLAHIGGQLSFTGGRLANPGGEALCGDGMTVAGDLFCSDGFSAAGEVRLVRARIGGQFNCTRGQFSNSGGDALCADGFSVEGGMFCGDGFSAAGKVRLIDAHVGGQFDCTGGRFSNPDGVALDLERAALSGPLVMQRVVVIGDLALNNAQVSGYYDDRESWPETLRLNGFVYQVIAARPTVTAKERLDWLGRNAGGFAPQIYEQLASVYRRAGRDEDARRVAIAKQRARRAQLGLSGKAWSSLLRWTIGYGYRTWQAGLWLLGLWVTGSLIFGLVIPDQLTAAKIADQPPFQPILYTLDVLLPVVDLHQRDAWVAHGLAQWISALFTLIGWVLTTAVVLSLTGVLKRDGAAG